MAERNQLAVGVKVRNVKTKLVGEVTDFAGPETAVVKYEGQASGFAARLVDLELLAAGEFDLVKKLVQLNIEKKNLAEALELAKSAFAKAEDEIYDYLLKHDTESTKVYEGYGRVSISGRSPKASITEENKEKAFEWIRSIGRGEIIKPTIHPATLNGFVDEVIGGTMAEVKKLPEFISYILKPKISITKK